jgi:hypothetical protein
MYNKASMLLQTVVNKISMFGWLCLEEKRK